MDRIKEIQSRLEEIKKRSHDLVDKINKGKSSNSDLGEYAHILEEQVALEKERLGLQECEKRKRA